MIEVFLVVKFWRSVQDIEQSIEIETLLAEVFAITSALRHSLAFFFWLLDFNTSLILFADAGLQSRESFTALDIQEFFFLKVLAFLPEPLEL